MSNQIDRKYDFILHPSKTLESQKFPWKFSKGSGLWRTQANRLEVFMVMVIPPRYDVLKGPSQQCMIGLHYSNSHLLNCLGSSILRETKTTASTLLEPRQCAQVWDWMYDTSIVWKLICIVLSYCTIKNKLIWISPMVAMEESYSAAFDFHPHTCIM